MMVYISRQDIANIFHETEGQAAGVCIGPSAMKPNNYCNNVSNIE